MMGTGFQGYIRRRPTRFVSSLAQCKHLGMRLSGLWVVPCANDLAVQADENAADHRVGTGVTPESGEAESAAHVKLVS